MARTHGRRATDFRDEMKDLWRAAGRACALCGQHHIDWDAPKGEDDSFELDHILPIKTHPHLEFDRSNVQPSALRCNRAKSTGSAAVLGRGITSEEW